MNENPDMQVLFGNIPAIVRERHLEMRAKQGWSVEHDGLDLTAEEFWHTLRVGHEYWHNIIAVAMMSGSLHPQIAQIVAEALHPMVPMFVQLGYRLAGIIRSGDPGIMDLIYKEMDEAGWAGAQCGIHKTLATLESFNALVAEAETFGKASGDLK